MGSCRGERKKEKRTYSTQFTLHPTLASESAALWVVTFLKEHSLQETDDEIDAVALVLPANTFAKSIPCDVVHENFAFTETEPPFRTTRGGGIVKLLSSTVTGGIVNTHVLEFSFGVSPGPSTDSLPSYPRGLPINLCKFLDMFVNIRIGRGAMAS